MVINRWDPLTDLVTLREAMSNLFDQSYVRPEREGSPGKVAARAMPIDLYERENDYVIKTYLPGTSADQVEINADQGTLTIKAHIPGDREREESQKYKWLVNELGFGDVGRTIGLPNRINSAGIEATVENGILTVTVPKAEEVKPKQIKVKAKGQTG